MARRLGAPLFSLSLVRFAIDFLHCLKWHSNLGVGISVAPGNGIFGAPPLPPSLRAPCLEWRKLRNRKRRRRP